jgi:hypothetical protein
MTNVRLYFKSQAIREDGEFLCLTDMWRAAAVAESKRPAEWLRHDATQEFASYLETVGAAHSLVRTAEGRSGATWAHWQLAMAYAKYLSPEFHAWCNEVVRAVMQGRAPMAASADLATIREAVLALTQVVSVLATRVNAIDERSAGVAFGAVRPWELGALKRRLSAAADVAVVAGAYPNRKSALPGLTMRVRTACGWTGTGSALHKMPAEMLPYAEREIATIEREYERTGNVRQLRLGGH